VFAVGLFICRLRGTRNGQPRLHMRGQEISLAL
jgi:hypothetical protein